MRAHAVPEYVEALLARGGFAHNDKVRKRVERAAAACGCKSGAVAMAVATAACVAWWLAERDGQFLLWPQGAYAVGAIVAATVAGKVGGIAVARLWLWGFQARLERLAGSRENSAMAP